MTDADAVTPSEVCSTVCLVQAFGKRSAREVARLVLNQEALSTAAGNATSLKQSAVELLGSTHSPAAFCSPRMGRLAFAASSSDITLRTPAHACTRLRRALFVL